MMAWRTSWTCSWGETYCDMFSACRVHLLTRSDANRDFELAWRLGQDDGQRIGSIWAAKGQHGQEQQQEGLAARPASCRGGGAGVLRALSPPGLLEIVPSGACSTPSSGAGASTVPLASAVVVSGAAASGDWILSVRTRPGNSLSWCGFPGEVTGLLPAGAAVSLIASAMSRVFFVQSASCAVA